MAMLDRVTAQGTVASWMALLGGSLVIGLAVGSYANSATTATYTQAALTTPSVKPLTTVYPAATRHAMTAGARHEQTRYAATGPSAQSSEQHQAPYAYPPASPSNPQPLTLTLAAALVCSFFSVALWRASKALGRQAHPLEQVALLTVTGTKESSVWVTDALATAPASTDIAPLAAAKAAASEALQSMTLPTGKIEDWRFTDLSGLKDATFTSPPASPPAPDVSQFSCAAADGARAVVVDGLFKSELSDLSKMPAGVYLGPIAGAPEAAAAHFDTQTQAKGRFFSTLNSALCQDVLCCVVPAGEQVELPLHVLYLSNGSPAEAMALSAPRLLVVLGEGAQLSLIEEFAGAGQDAGYLTIPTTEIVLAKDAAISHSVVQDQQLGGLQVKTTYVDQAASSSYSEVEVNTGGSLARHDLNIDQLGDATKTNMQYFALAGQGQCHDLHSKVLLNHPDSECDQLHKLIAAHPSARGVFDGNVRVGREAQKTDAKQLTRSLLMKRGATANIKPNLQIIADDVTCTHGCTVTDLDDEELFYLRSRGLSVEQAREALVFSFGFEVLGKLGDGQWKDLTERVTARVKKGLELAQSA